MATVLVQVVPIPQPMSTVEFGVVVSTMSMAHGVAPTSKLALAVKVIPAVGAVVETARVMANGFQVTDCGVEVACTAVRLGDLPIGDLRGVSIRAW